MTNRIGLMTFENNSSQSSWNINENRHDNTVQSNDNSIPFIPFKHISNQLDHKHGKRNFDNIEKEIFIDPPFINCFIERNEKTFKSKPINIWLKPFQERPRYMSDFEQEGILGEGTFSTVYKARRRLDGCLYAVKRLKTRSNSENPNNNLLKEIFALSSLQGCEYIIRYYNCWIEDSHIWIQTELCLELTLEIYPKGFQKAISLKHMGSFSQNYSQDEYGSLLDNSNFILPTMKSFNIRPERIPEPVIWIVLQSVACGLDYMHSRGSFFINYNFFYFFTF